MGVMAADTPLGTRIKRARERKRWSQRQLAEALGVDRKTVDNWENGRTTPRSSIGALEDVLGISLTEHAPEAETTADLAARLELLVQERLREREEEEAEDEGKRRGA